MLKSINHFLSNSGKNLKRSTIREILKHLQKPGMISFAGGLPAPETFPIEDLKEITIEILEKNGPDGLQYGTTEGDPLLRKMLVERHNRQGYYTLHVFKDFHTRIQGWLDYRSLRNT